MYELHFQVATPNHKPLDVTFRKNGENLSSRCSCSKEENNMCPHRIKILCGSTEGILNAHSEDVKLVRSWISGTDVGRALHALMQVTTRMQKVQDDFNAAMQRLEHELNQKDNVSHPAKAVDLWQYGLPGTRRVRSLVTRQCRQAV